MIEVLEETFRVDGNLGALRADGAFFDSVNSGPYVGGMPVALSLTGGAGLLSGATAAAPTASVVDSTNFIGILYNNSHFDTARGSGVKSASTDLTKAIPAVVYGPVKVRMFSGDVQADSLVISAGGFAGGAPFLTGDAWVVGDFLYISTGAAASAGKWTRTKGTANFQRAYGRVLEVQAAGGVTTSLTALMWSFAPGATTTVIPV